MRTVIALLGIYDVLVDVDRNGTFDHGFSAKDGADGEGKVGFTLQYGAAWLRTKLAMTSKHLLVNLAYSSSSRSGGTWSNSYSSADSIYSYVNPPVQSGGKHGYVVKLLLKHQSWSQFWNNPDSLAAGAPARGASPSPTTWCRTRAARRSRRAIHRPQREALLRRGTAPRLRPPRRPQHPHLRTWP